MQKVVPREEVIAQVDVCLPPKDFITTRSITSKEIRMTEKKRNKRGFAGAIRPVSEDKF
jgi:hypothetical protein